MLILLALVPPAWPASKPHVVALGKTQTVHIYATPAEKQTVAIDVRPLHVDGKLKEYTTGTAHDVTDRSFAVQRAYRLNDALPGDNPKPSRWIWQRGGWLLVDRASGHIVQMKLPEFDAADSEIAWYRDFAAYCGISENGERGTAMVWQIGARKAVYRKELGRSEADSAGPACAVPRWERNPPRVTFLPRQGEPFSVNVTPRHAAEPVDQPAE